jgi:hypothetical protein
MGADDLIEKYAPLKKDRISLLHPSETHAQPQT